MPALKIFVRERYGTKRIYMVESETATAIQCLTRRVTLEQSDLRHLQTLGVNVEQIQDPETSLSL